MTRNLVLRLLLAAFSASCQKPTECTCEVTEGAGTHRATARASTGETEANVRQRALTMACGQLCGAKGEPSAGCKARCQIDAGAGKIGMRARCVR